MPSWQDEVHRLQSQGKHDEIVPFLDHWLEQNATVHPPPPGPAGRVLVLLTYYDESLVEGGVSRCEPSSVEELVVEIDRHYGCSNDHPGGVTLSLPTLEEIAEVVALGSEAP